MCEGVVQRGLFRLRSRNGIITLVPDPMRIEKRGAMLKTSARNIGEGIVHQVLFGFRSRNGMITLVADPMRIEKRGAMLKTSPRNMCEGSRAYLSHSSTFEQ